MAEWITIDSLTSTESGGMALSITVVDSVELHVEASPQHRDIRILGEEGTVLKVRLAEDWTLHDILVDDVVVWTAADDTE